MDNREIKTVGYQIPDWLSEPGKSQEKENLIEDNPSRRKRCKSDFYGKFD